MTDRFSERFDELAKLITNNLEVVELSIASIQGYNDERAMAARKRLREIRSDAEIDPELTETDLLVQCFHNVRTLLVHEKMYRPVDETAYDIILTTG